jgi:hypothetical protein
MIAPRRAIDGRVLLAFAELDLPANDVDILEHLRKRGFHIRMPDVINVARGRVGWSKYERDAKIQHAPKYVDCSSFVKWVFGTAGVWLPRYSVQQREFGEEVAKSDAKPGDLIFMSGEKDRSRTLGHPGVGHVGIIASDRSVIHVQASKGAWESAVEPFLGERFRGIRRVFPNDGRCIVVDCPKDIDADIETSDDIYWMLRNELGI